jgi:phosphatidylglycerol lysyltransferase
MPGPLVEALIFLKNSASGDQHDYESLAWCAPATMCYLAAVWVAGLATGSIAHGPPRWLSGHLGVGLPSLGHGYWWTPLSAGLWASGLGGYLTITVLGLLILAPAEHRLGVTRTFTTLVVSQAVGFLLAAGLIKLAELAHEPWLSTLTGETAVGALPGVIGVGFALSRTLTPLWRRRLRLLLTVAITISVMYIDHLEQVALACGAVGGLLAVALTYDRVRPWADCARPSMRYGCWSACWWRCRHSALCWPR